MEGEANKPISRQLDMIIQKREIFDVVLEQIKKIILKSQMHGNFFTEQLLRIFFFERRELQNLCLINKNHSNETLMDSVGPSILQFILSFIDDASEQMVNSSVSLV